MPFLGNTTTSFNVDGNNINNGAITSEKIAAGAVVNADVNDSASIAGTKISADFGAQDLIVDTNLLFVDVSEDRVGIGTSSPSAPLHVSGNMYAGASIVATNDTTGLNWYNNLGLLRIQQDTSNTGYCFDIYKGGTNAVKIGFKSDGSAYFASDAEISGLTIGKGNNSHSSNVAIGPGVLGAATGNARNNVGVGLSALADVTDGDGNVGVGKAAATDITTGINNVAIGLHSLFVGTTAGSNVGIGAYSLLSTTDGTENVAIGERSLQANTSGQRNIGIGGYGLSGVTDGDNNIGIGRDAGNTITAGNDNIIIGKSAGRGITTGSSNVIIGGATSSTAYATDFANTVVIGPVGTERMRIDSSGRILFGTTSAVTGTSSQYSKLQIVGGSGSTAEARMSLSRNEASANVSLNELIGEIYFCDNQAGEYASIKINADGAAGSGDYPGRMEFRTTADGASSPTERMRIDSNGIVGINTTPAAWTWKALEVGGASIVGSSSSSADIFLSANSYYDGSWKYRATGVARNIYMNSDGIVFRQAASGSADGAITWSESMRVDSSNRLLIGYTSTSNASLLQVNGDARINSHTVGRGNFNNSSCTAFGNAVLAVNTGYNNTAFGDRALTANTSGGRNTAFGTIALRDCTTANNNTAVGCDALYQLTTGSGGNTAVGDQAARATTTGNYNTAIGYLSAYAQNTGTNNVCLGYAAGYSITSGTYNICIGSLSGDYVNSLTTGTSNILIGVRPTASASNGNYQIVLGNNPSSAQGKGNSTGFISPNGGGVYQGNNSSSWSTTSDSRLKKNIVDNTEGLDIINQVRVVNFEYRLPEEIEQEDLRSQALVKRDENDEITGLQGVKLGVIAQELQAVCSECVKEESSGVLGVVDDNLFWHMVNAVKELSAQNAALEARLSALEAN